jgi:HEAT repeat protein
MVDLTAGVRGQWWVIQFDPYTILFLVGIALPLVGYILFRHVRADSAVSIGQFAGVFLRGNPFLAAESLVRYHRARDERSIVTMTERMGRTKSPLAVEELLDALHDPRFYVRFEAIVSIARHRPDPRLTDALIETLEGTEPALSTMAAWGLGRIRDERAMDALRLGLNARYRSVQAHCARSLGSLGDQSIVPELLLRLSAENDPGLQLAFAAALGQLYATQAAAPLLSLLGASNYMDARSEFSLAIARLVGEEHRFIQLQRRVAAEPGTALSQSVTALKGHLVRSREHRAEIESRLADSAGSFAHGDLRAGVVSLCQAVQPYPADWSSGVGGLVISECLSQLALLGAQRIEYVVLLLHALTCAAAG